MDRGGRVRRTYGELSRSMVDVVEATQEAKMERNSIAPTLKTFYFSSLKRSIF